MCACVLGGGGVHGMTQNMSVCGGDSAARGEVETLTTVLNSCDTHTFALITAAYGMCRFFLQNITNYLTIQWVNLHKFEY